MHTHRRSRTRAPLALAALTAAAAGLTACASGAGTGTGAGAASSPAPVASSSPTGGITPGGPVVTPTPTPPAVHTPTTAPVTRGFPLDGYSTHGTVLTVYFEAGVCDKYGAVADQSQPGEVRVSIVVTRPAPAGQMCPMIVTWQHASVDLGRPLDGRSVVDASDGQTVSQGSPPGAGMASHGPGPGQ